MTFTLLAVVFGLWLLWATVSDGIFPLLTLKDSRRKPFALMAGLFSLIPGACLLGMGVTGSLTEAKLWVLALAYFTALLVLELVVAKVAGKMKEVRGRKGLAMSYRVPVVVILLFPLSFSAPAEPVWSLAATMGVALPIGILGRLRLISAEHVKPVEKPRSA